MDYTAMAFTEFGPPEVFSKVKLQLPEPNESQVQVKVDAASVNFADVMARKGRYSVSGPPYVPGIDFVGRVTKAGSSESERLVGKRVIGFGDTGSYATHVLASVDLVFEIPEDIPLKTAAACPLLIGTTYALVTLNRGIKEGDAVLVHAAAGGIGLTAVQMARRLGADSVIGLVSSDEKAAAVKENGADQVIVTSKTPDYPSEVSSKHPKGVDVVLNSVAGSTVQQDLEVLKPRGQLVIFGMASGEPGIVRTDQLHHSSRTLAGFSFGHLRRTSPKEAKKIMEQALPFVTGAQVKFENVTEYSLDDAANAHRDIESRKTVGKLILIPDA